MKNKRKIAILYKEKPKRKLDASNYLSDKTFSRFLVYQDMLKKLGLPQNVEIQEFSSDEFDKADPSRFDSIILDNYAGRLSSVERRLVAKGDVKTLEKIINFSGESLLKRELENRKVEDIDFRKYLRFKPKTFAANKVLTHFVLGEDQSFSIPLYGCGFDRGHAKNSLKAPEREKLIVKPVQGSLGRGVRKASASEVGLYELDNCIFGNDMVQQFIPQESIVRFDRPTDMRVLVTKVNGRYMYRGMIRVGKKGDTCSNLSQGGRGIGIVPGSKITSKLDRKIAKSYGVDPDNPTIPEEILKHSKKIADKFGYDVIGLDFVAEKSGPRFSPLRLAKRARPKFRLLEVNSNPGSKIFHYTKANTLSPKLEKFVSDMGLDEVMDDKIQKKKFMGSGSSIGGNNLAKAKLLRLLNFVKASGVDTSRLEKELDLSSYALSGSVYEGYSDPEISSVEGDLSFLGSQRDYVVRPNNVFENSLLKKYLEANGISKKSLRKQGTRKSVVERILVKNRLVGRASGVSKFLEQGIIDTYGTLRKDYNFVNGLSNGDDPLGRDSDKHNPTRYLNYILERLYAEAEASIVQINKTNKLFRKAYNSDNLREKKRLYAEVLELSPNYAKAAHNLGFVYQNLGNNRKAKQFYRRALEINPHRKATRKLYDKLAA